MTLWLYYRKSIDKMVLLNDSPSEEWKKVARDKDSELYVGGKIIFKNLNGELVERGEKQKLVAYALRIDAFDEDI